MWQPTPNFFNSTIRSLMYTPKKSGDNTPPCLVPHKASNKMFKYQNITIKKKTRGTFLCMSFRKRPQCEIVSKAFEKSRKATDVGIPLCKIIETGFKGENRMVCAVFGFEAKLQIVTV